MNGIVSMPIVKYFLSTSFIYYFNQIIDNFENEIKIDIEQELKKTKETLDNTYLEKTDIYWENYFKKGVDVPEDIGEEFFYILRMSACQKTKISTFLRNMFLVYLVTEFESFLSEILSVLYKKNPELLIKEDSIKYSDLKKFTSIAEIIDFMIDEKAKIKGNNYKIINQNIDEIKNYFLNNFGIDFSKSVDWKVFRERFYRRNIIVHNSGFADDYYRDKTGEKIKGELEISEEYIQTTLEIFEYLATSINKAAKSI